MAVWLKKWGYSPEQVQDFYPTPGTISTVMYYTGIHPMTGKRVSVTTDYREKQLQRALLQFSRPENANLVREALKIAGREDLIGNGPECLVRPAFRGVDKTSTAKRGAPHSSRGASSSSQNHRKTKGGTVRNAKNDVKRTKSDKLQRVFGKDAERIRKEADQMARKSSSKSKKHR